MRLRGDAQNALLCSRQAASTLTGSCRKPRVPPSPLPNDIQDVVTSIAAGRDEADGWP